MSQPLTPRGERSGLQMRIVTTEKRFVVLADEKLIVFWELESAICLDLIPSSTRWVRRDDF